jgi:hypothetical protein
LFPIYIEGKPFRVLAETASQLLLKTEGRGTEYWLDKASLFQQEPNFFKLNPNHSREERNQFLKAFKLKLKKEPVLPSDFI